MPTSLNPVNYLGPCSLDLDGIKKIFELVNKNFSDVKCYARDDIWRIYDESPGVFLEEVSRREKIDLFSIKAKDANLKREISIDLATNKAMVVVNVNPNDSYWHAQFLNVFTRCLIFPTPFIMKVYKFLGRGNINYCKITLYKAPVNSTWEGIKINLMSNGLWYLLAFVAGIVFDWVVSLENLFKLFQ